MHFETLIEDNSLILGPEYQYVHIMIFIIMLAAECFLITASLNKYTLILSDMRPEERERDFGNVPVKKFDFKYHNSSDLKKIYLFFV